MSIKDILVHVESGSVGERRLAYALSMADTFSAGVTGLTVQLSPAATAFASFGDPQVFGAAAEAAQETCKAARETFRRLTDGVAVRTRWREGEGVPADVVSGEALAADILILGREDDRDANAAFYALPAADVLLACNRPVLVLSSQAPETFAARRVLLAWKSTPEASRAAHDAMPILAHAEEVLMVEAADPKPPRSYEISSELMADHLRAHGVKVRLERVAPTGDIGAALVQSAAEHRSDLVVAGGYGHSRIREWVLGGVTYSLLADPTVSCLFSH